MLLPEDRLANPALVVVDMQNDFVRAGAPLEVPEARATIPAHRALLAAFRQGPAIDAGYRSQSCRVARRAPSARAANFSHATLG